MFLSKPPENAMFSGGLCFSAKSQSICLFRNFFEAGAVKMEKKRVKSRKNRIEMNCESMSFNELFQEL